MDHQEFKSMLDSVRARLSRTIPQAVLIYGRRAVPAAGFSKTELSAAGLDEAVAQGHGIPIDATRMTCLGCNVTRLEEFLRR